MMLASELALAGVKVCVLEQRPQRTEQSRALTVHPRTLEILDLRGIAGRFLGRGRLSPAAHFAALESRLDLSRLDTRHPYTLFLPQAQTEELLEERARELGVEVRRGHALTGLTQDEHGVEAQIRGPAGEYSAQARYAVGCDGARSDVRRLVGIGFPGRSSVRTAFLGDVEAESPPARPLMHTNAHGLVMAVPLGDGCYRFVVLDAARMHIDRSTKVTLDELKSSLSRILGSDFGIKNPRWLSRIGDATRLAERYRSGRVLLAGDAAHIHFPAGGQGLNVGLQDAMNLGWKLAAAVKGWAPPHLLDSYHDERHPVGQALLRNTEIQTKLMDFSEPSLALRDLFSDLVRLEPVNRLLAMQISALDVAYPPDPEAFRRASHGWEGRRIPDLALDLGGEPKRLFELLHRGRFVLLDLRGQGELRAAVSEGWSDRVDGFHATVNEPRSDIDGLAALLVRPDGHGAWASDDSATCAVDLPRALAYWCGEALPSGRSAAPRPRLTPLTPRDADITPFAPNASTR